MKKHHLAIAGLVIAGGSLAYEMIHSKDPNKEHIAKTAHMGIGLGLGLIAICLLKKD